MNNIELDLSAFKELDADGKIQWQQTLSKIVKSDKIYDYFNFQPLRSDFKSEYANVVDFDFTINIEKIEDVNNTYFTYNSEKDHVPVKLKLFKKGSFDSTYKEKNVDLKIKVGGLAEQVIWDAKQEKIKQIFNEHVNNSNFYLDSDYYVKWLKSYISPDWTWFSLLAYFKNQFFTYFELSPYIFEKEITSYVDINFVSVFYNDDKEYADLNKTLLEERENGHNIIKIKGKITPKQMHRLKVGYEWNISFHQNNRTFSEGDWYNEYFIDMLSNFGKETVVFKQDSISTPVKGTVLIDYLKNKLEQLFESSPYYKEIPKYLEVNLNFVLDKDLIYKNYYKDLVLQDTQIDFKKVNYDKVFIETNTYILKLRSNNKHHGGWQGADKYSTINVKIEK